MAGTYELWLTDDKGARLVDLNDSTMLDAVLSFSCTRVVNGIGTFTAFLPQTFDTSLLNPNTMDRMFQVWRKPAGGRLSLWRVYFVRQWGYSTIGAEETIRIAGPDVNDLLRRRIALGYASTSAVNKNDSADDMMKEIVTEAISDSTNPAPDEGTRVWSDLSIAADVSAGPTVSRSFPFDKLLLPSGGGVLTGIVMAARKAGTEVFFDIQPNIIGASTITFEFRTFTNQPGQDVTDKFAFSQESGSLANPSLTFDYTQEVNYVYAAGRGRGEARNVQQVADSSRYNASQWNVCEGFADARRQSADNAVREVGRRVLENGRPIRRFNGVPLDVEGAVFGKDWNFGDKARSIYRGFEFDSIIRTLILSVNENGRERIGTKLEFED